MTTTGKAQFTAKWDVRTGSPRKLWRALNDFLDENGFEHEYEQLRLEESPIEGTAAFADMVMGQKEHERQGSFWLLKVIVGFILCLTIVLIPPGLALFRRTRRTVRTVIKIDVEGEVYRSRGANVRADQAAEVLGVIGDARVTMQVWAGEPLKNTHYAIWRVSGDEGDAAILRREFDELTSRLDGLFPGVTLPMPSNQIDEIT